MNEVDRFLTRVKDALRSYEQGTGGAAALSASDVVTARFQPTKFRSGYNQDEVDAFLDRVVEALRSHEGAGTPTIL